MASLCHIVRSVCKPYINPWKSRDRRHQLESRNSSQDDCCADYGMGGRFCYRKKELGFICLSGLATGGSWLCYYKALQDGLASVVVPIDKLSILVTILFSYLVFHEKLGKKEAVGLVLIVAGTLLMLL